MKTLVKVEVYKLKRSKILLITTLLTLFALLQGWQFARVEGGDDIRPFLYQGSMAVYSWLIYPLIITVVLAIMAKMEHSQNSWKQLLALPVERGKIYSAKLAVGTGIIVYSLILLYVGMIVAAFLLGIESIPYVWVLKRLVLLFCSSFAIIGVIYFLSYQFQHFSVPIVVGAGFAFPSMLAANSERFWIFYPWDYPIVASMNYVFDTGGKDLLMLGISSLLFLIFILAGFLRFRSKDVL